ncbi:c-type cytochrome [Bradyrhizobium sp. Leo121]|uniref:c-type cytochrome n=1 Tax=Bradyrhizobium sp. Leo121 TaxID=1571195 RepID=UPI001028FE36|nr:c-type cytochrome [Bradyrhizobium sp. Leo121]RZN36205.1 cytochrome C [Bradyrhizobium sp. Leo121]
MSSLPRPRVWVLVLTAICVAAAIAAQLAWNSQHQTERVARAMTGGDPSHAPEIMRRYGCTGCHTIPGVAGADGQVGTPLAGLRGRVYIAGVAANSPDNLVRWIVAPQAFSPRTAMPATGIAEAEAGDVAAYLYAR